MRINIKPLSVNKCWRGRRFKTDKYKVYENELLYTLPKSEIKKCKLYVYIKFGFSSKASDIDNPVKPILDILQKKYGFNDNMIYKLKVEKFNVKKGDEYIEFDIKSLDK